MNSTDRIEIWSRRFVRPRVKLTRPAHPHPLAAWNRYGGIPGTPHKGVTIGVEVALRGRGISIRWAKPVVRTLAVSTDGGE